MYIYVYIYIQKIIIVQYNMKIGLGCCNIIEWYTNGSDELEHLDISKITNKN